MTGEGVELIAKVTPGVLLELEGVALFVAVTRRAFVGTEGVDLFVTVTRGVRVLSIDAALKPASPPGFKASRIRQTSTTHRLKMDTPASRAINPRGEVREPATAGGGPFEGGAGRAAWTGLVGCGSGTASSSGLVSTE